MKKQIFYPQAREATRDNDLIDEAAVEHATVKHLIGAIEGMEVDEELHERLMHEHPVRLNVVYKTGT